MQEDFVYSASSANDNLAIWWLRLIRDRRWSASQKRELINFFENPVSVLNAPHEQIRKVITGKPRNPRSMLSAQCVQADLDWLAGDRHHLIALDSVYYPSLLREIPDPPLVLFAIGDIGLLNEPQVAVVGSRRPTPVGDRVTRDISNGLASLGIVVTSGMALGIDAAAHQAALSDQGSSVAVLGNGLDTVYPSRNRELFSQLASNGLIVSEYPLGVKPSRYTFPQRNRIISGLSHGVVIVEAAERSGTLVTARLALEQNKEVMVVPGSALSSQYRGSHDLIKQGAALVSTLSDVVHVLSEPLSGFLRDIQSDADATNGLEAGVKHLLLQHISTESTSVDQIISSSQLTSAEVSSMLLELELKGVVAIASDGGYVNLS